MLGEAVAGSFGSGAALLAYAVRAPRSSLFAPSVFRGNSQRRSVSLTFDDGPSESSPQILALLKAYDIKATFFQCGANVRRLPEIARAVVSEGHGIGNHSDTHPNFCFHSSTFILSELTRAQSTIEETVGRSPRLMRAPFGVRWFGFREAQHRLNLLGVMWTVMGNDWKLSGPQIATRLVSGASNGAIFCLHDGRELQSKPDISATAEALRIAVPQLREMGFHFETVDRILCPKN